MILLSIDPGVNGCGCALWEGAQLLRAGYVTNPAADGGKVDVLERARAMAASVAAWAREPSTVGHVVIEVPQTYGGRAAKGDANDLIVVGLVVGALAADFPKAEIDSVYPREWKGNVPKDVTSARVLFELSEFEGGRVELPRAKSLRHNVYDGIAIGLWFLKKQKVRK